MLEAVADRTDLGKLVAPWAEYVAHSLWYGTSQKRNYPRLKTPLTQIRRREAKGSAVPEVQLPKQEHQCRGCGKAIRTDTDQCADCAVSVTHVNLTKGRKMAHGPESLARRSKSNQSQAEFVKNWKAEQLPTWLTRESGHCHSRRAWYPLRPKVRRSGCESSLFVGMG